TTAQSEASDARRRVGAASGCQAERLGLAVQLAPGDAALSAHRAPGRIDPYTLHRGQVNDKTTIAGGVAVDVVAATTYCHQQIVDTGKMHRGDDIRHASAAYDHGRMAVNHPIPHLPSFLIADITGTQQRATQACFEIVDSRFLEDGVLEARAHCRDHVQVWHH